jgi:hypothetical protein
MSAKMKQMLQEHGIYSLHIRAPNNTTKVITGKEIDKYYYDPESGGIFYTLKEGSQVIPTSDRWLYVGPSGIIQIAFNGTTSSSTT